MTFLSEKIFIKTYLNSVTSFNEHFLRHGKYNSEEVFDVEAFAGQAEHRLLADHGLDNLEVGLEAGKVVDVNADHHVHGTLEKKFVLLFISLNQ